ncbi:MAG: hypothetical protein JRJ16_09555 [Deltaproteobacteria bacterium]|nr:hypothetical protein [Deltaproteobacteria bacterium]
MKKQELKLETVQKRAEIRQEGESILSGDFFLSVISPNGQGPERIIDLLNGEKRFLPFRLEGGEVILLRRREILTVVPVGLFRKIVAEIRLTSGDTLKGHIFADLPESHSRLSDFFNRCGDFFYLEAGGRGHLVNSLKVLSIRQGE